MILKYCGVWKKDLLIIINAAGINTFTIEADEYAHDIGAKAAAIKSPEFSRNAPGGIPVRHPSNRNLCGLADIVVDVHVPASDAMLSLPGVPQKVGDSSTLWTGINIKGGDREIEQHMLKYRPRVHRRYPIF